MKQIIPFESEATPEEHFVIQNEIRACRSGWLGVWDAIVSAITKKPRFSTPVTMRFGVYISNSEYGLMTSQITIHRVGKKIVPKNDPKNHTQPPPQQTEGEAAHG